MGRYYLIPLDGTGYFSSTKLHSPACLEKTCSKTGKIAYHLQALGAAIVHPDSKIENIRGVTPTHFTLSSV